MIMEKYSVTSEYGCTVVRGHIGLMELGQVMAKAHEEDVLDTWLSRTLEAQVVFGAPSACRESRKRLGFSPDLPEDLSCLNLESRVERWYKYGDVGQSSLAMVCRLLPEALDGVSAQSTETPRDSIDFRRCALLLRWAPELKSHLGRMKNVSDCWALLGKYWDDLMALLEKENPEWYTEAGSLTAMPQLDQCLREFNRIDDKQHK